MSIRKSEGYEDGEDKVGIERLAAPFDGGQGRGYCSVIHG